MRLDTPPPTRCYIITFGSGLPAKCVWGVYFPMNWLRSKAKRLSWLALLALALQLGLSFGHVHHGFTVATEAAISTVASAPSDGNGGNTDGRQDVCAICATVALSHALIDSTPPVLPLPVEVIASDSLPAFVASSAIASSLGFQSRAPPFA